MIITTNTVKIELEDIKEITFDKIKLLIIKYDLYGSILDSIEDEKEYEKVHEELYSYNWIENNNDK